MLPTVDERFADDPLVSHSAQFPLARPPAERESADIASPPEHRPWNLRGMRPCRGTGARVSLGSYDHEFQRSRDAEGRLMHEVAADDPSAKTKTNNDGDEGPSEDWEYDFAPDHPTPL